MGCWGNVELSPAFKGFQAQGAWVTFPLVNRYRVRTWRGTPNEKLRIWGERTMSDPCASAREVEWFRKRYIN